MDKSLANRIKKIRIDAGDSPQAAADKVGVSRQGYVKWETGDTANMKLGNLRTFCDKYGVNIATLISGEKTYPQGEATVAKANETAAGYIGRPLSQEARAIAEYYDRLPIELRTEFRVAMAKAFLQMRLSSPDADLGQIGDIVDLMRNN